MAVAEAYSETKSAVEIVVDSIRDGVRNGQFMPGQRLVEADITDELSVSRGTVREALRRLAAEGLVEIQHHRGAKIRRLTRDEVLSLYDVREVLEALSARLAAQNLKKKSSAENKLVSLWAEMQSAMKDGALARYVMLNNDFHDLLVEISANSHLPPLIRTLQTPVVRMLFGTSIDLAAIKASHKEHGEIMKAVRAGDPDGADAAMRRHIRRSRQLVQDLPDSYFKARASSPNDNV